MSGWDKQGEKTKPPSWIRRHTRLAALSAFQPMIGCAIFGRL